MSKRIDNPKEVSLVLSLFLLSGLALVQVPDIQINQNTNIVVNTLEDGTRPDKYCTLREAIIAANTNTPYDGCAAGSAENNDTITFSVNGTLVFNQPLPKITNSGPLTIDGEGKIALSGNNIMRIFYVNSSVILTLKNLIIARGNAYGLNGGAIYNDGGNISIISSYLLNNTAGLGGALYNNGGTVSVYSSNISHNSAPEYNVGLGGGIYSSGNLTINDCMFYANHSGKFGGGVYNSQEGTTTINDSTFSHNVADSFYAGAVYNSGNAVLTNNLIQKNTSDSNGGNIANDQGNMVIDNCMIRDGSTCAGSDGIINKNNGWILIKNSTIAHQRGAAIFNIDSTMLIDRSTLYENGGALLTFNGILTVTNSTITTNSRGLGGGIYSDKSNVQLNSVTIFDNSSGGSDGPGGGGILIDSSNVFVKNTIIAGNHDGSRIIQHPDCSGNLISQGYNLIEDTTGCTISGTLSGVITGTSPLIGPLAINGGPTMTRALLKESPGIDAGDPNDCLTIDQRGFPRPVAGDSNHSMACDLGAYEYYPASSYLPSISAGRQTTCTPILFDDFSNPDSGWPWAVRSDANLLYVDGEYRILVKTYEGAWVGATPEISGTNYILAVDAGFINYEYGTYGLVFGISDDWSQFYSFEIGDDAYFTVRKHTPDFGWIILAESWSPYIYRWPATNRMEIERNGVLINAYVNKHFLASVSDSSYMGLRRMGIDASTIFLNMPSTQPNLEVEMRFDNFGVYPLECGITANPPINPEVKPGILPTFENQQKIHIIMPGW